MMVRKFGYYLFVLFLLAWADGLFARLSPGFNETEAANLSRLTTSYTFLDLYGDDSDIVPPDYEKYYTSGVFGMDNMYQIYLTDSFAVFNFRGSTDKQISWLENIHSAMIPATGTIYIEGEKIDYCFAEDSSASVHGGFALGIAYLHKDILFHIKNLNRLGHNSFIITGHSQGGALSNMLMAYLNNLPDSTFRQENIYKTYAFAAPMIGNKAMTMEYNRRYCKTGWSYNIVNPKDGITKLPTSFNDSTFIGDNIQQFIVDPSSVNYKKLAIDAAYKIFNHTLTGYVNKIGQMTANKISKELGDVLLPEYTKDINFFYLDNVVEIPIAVYPLILRDSLILENDSLMAVYERGKDGVFLDKAVYKSEPFGFQHKPYNYYVSFLKKYFPDQYMKLDRKYLPENL